MNIHNALITSGKDKGPELVRRAYGRSPHSESFAFEVFLDGLFFGRLPKRSVFKLIQGFVVTNEQDFHAAPLVEGVRSRPMIAQMNYLSKTRKYCSVYLTF